MNKGIKILPYSPATRQSSPKTNANKSSIIKKRMVKDGKAMISNFFTVLLKLLIALPVSFFSFTAALKKN